MAGDFAQYLPLELILLVVAVIFIIMLVLSIVLWVKLSKLRTKYMMMINGGGSENMESLLIDMQGQINRLKEGERNAQESIQQHARIINKMKANVGLQRFNAFAEGGNDLSFSVAIVDNELDGVVLTGIHNREQVYVYAKPVAQGQSKYTLSPEEQRAIALASQKK